MVWIQVQDLLSQEKQQHKLLNRIACKYGDDCTVKFGNWSRKSQMKGCHPTPNLHLKQLMSRCFHVHGRVPDVGDLQLVHGRYRQVASPTRGCTASPALRVLRRQRTKAVQEICSLAGISPIRPKALSRKKVSPAGTLHSFSTAKGYPTASCFWSKI